jgi:hypothetical protein
MWLWLVVSLILAILTTFLHRHVEQNGLTTKTELRIVLIILELATAFCGVSFGAELWSSLH